MRNVSRFILLLFFVGCQLGRDQTLTQTVDPDVGSQDHIGYVAYVHIDGEVHRLVLPDIPENLDVPSAEWKNLHKDDLDLAGVIVMQYPENPYEIRSFVGMHPAAIFYVFWDGRVRQVGYDPDGVISNDFWWDDPMEPGEGWWDDVDFSYGSDPNFERHQDPRRISRRKNG